VLLLQLQVPNWKPLLIWAESKVAQSDVLAIEPAWHWIPNRLEIWIKGGKMDSYCWGYSATNRNEMKWDATSNGEEST